MSEDKENQFPPVKTKNNFVARYEKGEFGNASPTWNGISEFLQSQQIQNNERLYHIRNRVKGGSTWYDVPGYYLPEKWEQICMDGEADPKNLYISEMAPTELTVMQGEVMLTEKGMTLTASYLNRPMREALKESSFHRTGLRASLQLRVYFNALSWDWINVLFDRYPDHVIEFSCYSRCWGTLAGYNVVFWEVRKY